MKIYTSFIVSVCLFTFFSASNCTSAAWIDLPSSTYSSNSKTLSIAVNSIALRLMDSGRNFDIPIDRLLAEHPSVYKTFQAKFSTNPKNQLSDPKLNEWQLVVHDTGREYKISIQKGTVYGVV